MRLGSQELVPIMIDSMGVDISSADKSAVKFDQGGLAEATRLHVGKTMERKSGSGQIFINCMEKLMMNAPRETLSVRMNAALVEEMAAAAGSLRGQARDLVQAVAAPRPTTPGKPAVAPAKAKDGDAGDWESF